MVSDETEDSTRIRTRGYSCYVLVMNVSITFSMFHCMEPPSSLWKAEFKCDGLANLFGGSSKTV